MLTHYRLLAKSANARLAIIKRVLVGLSGGVDSSVAVHILKEQGFEVAGCVLKMSECHQKAVEAAKRSAEELGIRLFVVDTQSEFKERVISYFESEYRSGRTPNPCVICNPTVKFKALLETADINGYTHIATGHYARIEEGEGIFYLKKGLSLARDQSYMLGRLGQEVLSRLLLPLASVEKSQVRELAAKLSLHCADEPDSQEICFVDDNDYAGYLERNFGISEGGDFVAPDGSVCGRHKGIIHYTVGQRKGLGIALGKPAFITDIDVAANKIHLGFEMPMVEKVVLDNITETFVGAIEDGMRAEVKLRSTAKPFPATIKLAEGSLEVICDQPQKRVPSGQSGILYSGDTLLGGGIIR